MDRPVVVKLGEVRQAVELLLDEAERRFGPDVDLKADHYWDIDPAVAFAPESREAAEGIWASQLSDDVRELRELLHRDSPPVLWHDLAHLTGILRRIAALDQPSG
jgi:hypothetical protein